MNKNIAFVISERLPVPAVKDGAVECLVNNLLKENEIEHLYNFFLIGPYNKDADNAAKKYKYTNFIFINMNPIIRKIEIFLSKVFSKVLKSNYLFDKISYIKKVKKELLLISGEVNYLIVENDLSIINGLSDINIPVLYHLHNDNLNSNVVNAEEILSYCSGVIAVSEFIKKRVATIKFGESKTKVLLNCADTQIFDPGKYNNARKIIREKYNIKDNDVLLIFSGRLHTTKGVLELVEAFSDIPDSNIYLMIVGGVWYGSNKKDEYIEKVKKASNMKKNQIIWIGYVPHKEMPKYLASADIAVFPSVWDEPGSIAVLEAESMGVPIIATRSGGIPENATEATTYFVTKEDRNEMIHELTVAIQALAFNKEKRNEMAKASINYMSNRRPKDYYRCFSEIMEKFYNKY